MTQAVYYPSYSREELSVGPLAVRLDLPKALGVIGEALRIYREGFAIPLRQHEANGNRFDVAYQALVERLRPRAWPCAWPCA